MKKNKGSVEPRDMEREVVLEEGSEIEGKQQLPGEEEILPEGLSPEEAVASMQSALEEMTAKAEEYLDGWQRSRAEFANYKKRILKENSEIHQVARGEVIKIFLDILDDLQRALEEKPTQGEGKSWAEGIEIIVQKLSTRLEAEGVKPMNPLGEEFDPNIHEALMQEESDEYESGQIIEVMQEGYWIGDKVLRPALVRVAA